MVGEFVVKQEGSKRVLIINFKGSNVTPDVAAYPQVMRAVIEILKTNDADEIILSEFYERIYDEKQTKMLREVSDVILKFETENVWSPSHLGLENANRKILQARHDAVLSIVNQTHVDPFAAYIQLLTFIKEATQASTAENSEEKKDAGIFLGTLQFMRQLLENTTLIAKSKQFLAQMGKMPEGRAIYHSIFESAIKPSFIGSRIFFTGTETLELLDQYEVQGSKVYVYRHPDKIEYLYYINPPEYTLTPEKYFLLEKTKEIVAGHRPANVGFMDMEQARKYFRKIYIATISDLATKNNINLTVEEKEELATIVSRYTIGYGILEIILADRQITDVYIDSPLGTKPIYLVHSKYGQCQTNIIFSEEEARATVSRFRALSGRPFDEAHPILDFDLADLQTRIAAIGKPLAVDGTAFALRLHKDTPWTLAQFLDFKMFTPITAGILSFFVDAQASMLIVGSRGSGKCLSPDALIHAPDGRLIPIQNFVEDELAKATDIVEIEDGIHAKAENSFVYSMNGDLKLNSAKVDRVWKRTAPEKMYKIKTRSGRTLTTTPEHPFFVVENGLVTHKQAKDLNLKEKIATARELKASNNYTHAVPIADLLKLPTAKTADLNADISLELNVLHNQMELPEISKVTGISYKSMRNLKDGIRTSATLSEVEKIATATNQNLNELLAKVDSVNSGTNSQIIKFENNELEIDDKIGFLMGLIVGDGHVDECEVNLANNNSKLLQNFAQIIKIKFNVESKVRSPKTRAQFCQASSRLLAKTINAYFQVPFGDKCAIQEIPPVILASQDKVLAAFLKGYFDCDAHVSKKKTEVELVSASQKLIKQTQLALLRFGVLSNTNEKIVKDTTYYTLYIRGENCKKFHEKVGFTIDYKQQRLAEISTNYKFNSNVDVIPNAFGLIKHSKEIHGIGKTSLDQKEIGRNNLQRLSTQLFENNANSEVTKQVEKLAFSDLFWDEISEIKEVKPDFSYVYDLTIEPFHSFVANGIVAHNTSMLQAMMQEIPQNLRIIVQEDSVTGDSKIKTEQNGVEKETTVGELIDGLISKYGKTEINGREVVPFNPELIKVYAMDKNGQIKRALVSQFIRHKVSKPIYEVETESGKKIKVTSDHSLFTKTKEKPQATKTNLLKAGELIATTNEKQNQRNCLIQVQLEWQWEKVKTVKQIEHNETYVYDFSVPECESFVCENIIAHNTQELPIPQLKELGFNAQRLKTRPPLGAQSDAEVSAEDALRTALRLGDSVLIVGEVRSSIRGTEEVLVVEKGITKRIPIRDLENKTVSDYKVPTLDFDLKFRLSPLGGFVKHQERSKLIELTTKTGRKVTVTHDHSLFTSTRDLKIAAIECKDLKVGDQLVIPSKVPCGFNDISTINVLDYLPDFRVKNFEEPIRKAISYIGWKEASKVAEVKTGDIYNYFRTNQKSNMTYVQYANVMQAAQQEVQVEKLLVTNGTGTPIPSLIEVNEDFCKFLGYYLSEGYYHNEKSKGGSVVLTNSNETILADMRRVSQNCFGITPKEKEVHGLGYSTQLHLHSTALATFIERLDCGRICTEKRIPPFMYGLSKSKISAFLRALYDGDGCLTSSESSGNLVRYNTTSRKLAEDVSYLLLAFGIVSRIYMRKREDKPGNDVWNVDFKDRKMVKTFVSEIGLSKKDIKLIEKAWAHTKVNTIYFDKDELRKHLTKYPRKYRHLFRFGKCSKNYLEKIVNDPECTVSNELKAFANGEFYLDEISEVKEITLDTPEPVYDLSVPVSQNFIGGFGGILLHNTEAKALYEAMRVGAVGNVVMGTIHGESAYSIWDRVVNDLGVPTTSFKATDMCIVAAPIRFKGSLKRNRRLVEITEVGKDWSEDPGRENGFLNWAKFDAGKDTLELYKDDLVNSAWIKRVMKNRGLTYDEIWQEIATRAASKQYLVNKSHEFEIPNLLEAVNTIRAHNKLMNLAERQRDEFGGVDHSQLAKDWQNWVDTELIKEVIGIKKLSQ